jgi:hypothetical protein
LFQLLKQNLVGFDDAEIRIVRQDDVVHRIKRISPLALRTQHLLQQTEVLDCDSQLASASFQEINFLGGQVSLSSPA